ncbi:nucleoside-diphosphate-sugar epimerase [Candidatus Pacearchaeota archaeon CG_4_9_14_0_2_um_filter_39_13]|nr:NAD-dependent epimerase/dehydratase family protein [Candidatus Pacearchaeota archaeon]OIO42512.1 MAG: nucleoside-diphosphate-sugar epimerase [Candidatus Pacearchaeota archaeon CG1_02_39_14]PJC44263.1 MAG: nucleoside-diphosphate-sugar epimerase [Candidatus Pacearchaeota archaeon CG_4_9_14_0_2_um_filter_39_13]
MANILVTGGAGFIGSFIVDELISRGHKVRILDSLVEQVHKGKVPVYLNKEAEFIRGDVCDKEALAAALKDIDFVFHKAAEVGVGQSMYEVSRYVNANAMGTANLLDIIINNGEIKKRIKKIIVASSMSPYGEGMYSCEKCGIVNPSPRSEERIKMGIWELNCPKCNSILNPVPTPETKTQDASSVYALTKKFQEDLVMNAGKAYNIPVVAFRYFNVYGPRQSLSNPYTGVAAIFMSRVKNNHPPMIFEDGNQLRDFVSVHDIVQANMLAMEKDEANYQVYNVASGKAISVRAIAEMVARLCGKDIKPMITGQSRKGDIRHCFADITKIQKSLGFEPKVDFEEGMKELIKWAEDKEAKDLVDYMSKELKDKGIIS